MTSAPRTATAVNVVTLAAVVLFWLVSTSWQPWTLFERAGFSSDFYDEQARVFLRGRLAVDPAVPGPEGFLVDGATYLYYGPFLALVRLPFQLFGDVFTGRLVRASMLIAVVVLCRWSARLVRAAGRVVRPNTSDAGSAGRDAAWPIGLFTAAVAFSPALFAAGWISVYNETELWAFTLAVVGVTLLLEWAAGGFADRRLLIGAAGAALAAALTRAPIGLGVALAIGVAGAVLTARRRNVRVGGLAMALGLTPLVVHAAVNWAKFGSAFSVPGSRQVLSLQDPARAAWFAGNNDSFFSARFLTTTISQYLRPDAIRFERLVPGIRFGPIAPDRASYPLLGNTPASSLTLTATLLALLAAVGVVWIVRRRARMWALVVVCTAIGALPTLLIGFLANRYLIDLLSPLVVAGAIGVWVITGDRLHTGWRAAGIVLVVWGAWVNASLATWALEQKSAGFTELRYRVDEAVFSPPSPGLVQLDPAAPVPRDGMVGLSIDDDGRCVGVYTAEQGRWVAIERSGSTRQAATIAGRNVEIVADPVTGEYFIRTGDALTLVPPDRIERSTNSAASSGTDGGDDESTLCRQLAARL